MSPVIKILESAIIIFLLQKIYSTNGLSENSFKKTKNQTKLLNLGN
jgi:hypothetical protein